MNVRPNGDTCVILHTDTDVDGEMNTDLDTLSTIGVGICNDAADCDLGATTYDSFKQNPGLTCSDNVCYFHWEDGAVGLETKAVSASFNCSSFSVVRDVGKPSGLPQGTARAFDRILSSPNRNNCDAGQDTLYCNYVSDPHGVFFSGSLVRFIDDADGDGVPDGIDNCDIPNPVADCDSNPATPPEQCDDDGDGFGNECDCPPSGINDPFQFPGAREFCDGVDNDCNGTVDDGFDVMMPDNDCSVGTGDCTNTAGMRQCIPLDGDRFASSRFVRALDIDPGTDDGLPFISSSTLSRGPVSLYYFMGDDGGGEKLWRSDGSACDTPGCYVNGFGTFAVSDHISPSNPTPTEANFFYEASDGTLYFAGTDANGAGLWKKDAVRIETLLVTDPSGFFDWVFALGEIDGNVLFLADADGGDFGFELWRTDGTPEGTWEVSSDLAQTGSIASRDDYAFIDDSLLVIRGNSGGVQSGLWRSDGTTSGTYLIPVVDVADSTIESWNGEVYFGRGDAPGLWKTDGTEAGTVPVREDVSPVQLEGAGGSVFFYNPPASDCCEVKFGSGCGDATCEAAVCAEDDTCCTGPWDARCAALAARDCETLCDDAGLWGSDGTPGGTTRLRFFSEPIGGPTEFKGELFFVGNDGFLNRELWKSDGTVSGTVLVKNLTGFSSFEDSDFAGHFTPVGDVLYMVADEAFPETLWRSDGTEAGTYMLSDQFTGTVFGLQNVNGKLMFMAADTNSVGEEVWVVSNETECVDQQDPPQPLAPGTPADEFCPSEGGPGDNDCDGFTDEDDADQGLENWYPDVDGDTFGDNEAAPLVRCEGPPGYVADNDDVNDSKSWCTTDYKVSRLEPPDAATQMPLSTIIRAEFCEKVDPTSLKWIPVHPVQDANVELQQCDGTQVEAGIDFDGDLVSDGDGVYLSDDETVVNFRPSSLLAPGTAYSVLLGDSPFDGVLFQADPTLDDGLNIEGVIGTFRTTDDRTGGDAVATDVGDGLAGTSLEGEDPDEGFGRSQSVIGDVNGDLVEDFLVGAPFYQAVGDVGANRGRVFLFLGNSGAQDDGGSPRVIFTGEAEGDFAGFEVSTAGNVDGDPNGLRRLHDRRSGTRRLRDGEPRRGVRGVRRPAPDSGHRVRSRRHRERGAPRRQDRRAAAERVPRLLDGRRVRRRSRTARHGRAASAGPLRHSARCALLRSRPGSGRPDGRG